MWISMYDFSKDLLKFKDYLLQNDGSAWGEVDVITGVTSQVSFLVKGKLFVMHIQPRFSRRSLELMFFEVTEGQAERGGRYYWNDSNFKKKNIPFFKKVVKIYKAWLESLGFDGILCFSRRNFDVVESFKLQEFENHKLLAVGKESQGIISLLSKLELTSIYYGKKDSACLKNRVFDDSYMLVNWSFYPTPGISFIHAPVDLYQMEDTEDYYTVSRCTTMDELREFFAYLETCDKNWDDLNTEVTEKLLSISPNIERKGFRVGLSMDGFKPWFKSHAHTHSAYFNTKEEAIQDCAVRFDTYARSEVLKTTLASLFLKHDANVQIERNHVTFFGQRLPFLVTSKFEENKATYTYCFGSVDTVDFECDNQLLEEVSKKITEFAKKQRLPFMFNSGVN